MSSQTQEEKDLDLLKEAVQLEIESNHGEPPECCGEVMGFDIDCDAAFYECEKCNNYISYNFKSIYYPAEPDVGIMQSGYDVEVKRCE